MHRIGLGREGRERKESGEQRAQTGGMGEYVIERRQWRGVRGVGGGNGLFPCDAAYGSALQ